MHKSIQTHGALFQAVQLARLFPDSKTFPDLEPSRPPEEIEAAFRALLADFVDQNFRLPAAGASPGGEPAGKTPAPAALREHIDALWPLLERRPAAGPLPPGSSLIPLPYRYIVPGGRFREIYYWDSYFTCEGLAAAGRIDLVEDMLRNFANLIERFGHIPNGSRTYYLSRSQPPFFWQMLQILERVLGFEAVVPYLPQLEAEYAYWMAGCPGRVVALPDGLTLQRYWDERSEPREEAFREDIETFHAARPERQGQLYRSLRAGAESGWDFCARWTSGSPDLAEIHTIDLLPVDLNSLLYGMERQLGEWLARLGQAERAASLQAAADRRAEAIQRYCWDAAAGWFCDYDFPAGQRSPVWSLAGLYPLYCGLATPAQAAAVAALTEQAFLRPGGLVSSLCETGQQWDAPNGWAPLQWIAVQGLRRYGHHALAREIAGRFTRLVEQVYQKTGKIMEKYNVCDLSLEAGGGEYPLQDGFGWTNGVVRAFLHDQNRAALY